MRLEEASRKYTELCSQPFYDVNADNGDGNDIDDEDDEEFSDEIFEEVPAIKLGANPTTTKSNIKQAPKRTPRPTLISSFGGSKGVFENNSLQQKPEKLVSSLTKK